MIASRVARAGRAALDSPPVETRQVLAFGVFELDLRSGELRKQGVKVRLADQPFQILRLLIERRGDLVSREELRQALWSADTFVDFDVGLSSAVRKLRDALGDSAENPQFIETIPKRGYRFIAPVKPIGVEEMVTVRHARPSALWVGAGAALAVAITAIVLYQRSPWSRLHGASTAGRITSLAVLPFDNLTGDAANRYLVDGITDELTTNLAQVDGLQVISRASAMRYRETKKSLPEIGHELGVDGLVLGAIVKTGDHLHVSAQLIYAATDRHVWAHNYDSDIKDAVTLQNEIANAIARAANGGVAGGSQRFFPARDVKSEAYLLYLKGLSSEARGGYEGQRSAESYFERAVAEQPDFAMGHAALAQARLQFLFTGPIPPRETIPKAEAAARKALALDDTNPLAHRILAEIQRTYYWQWLESDKEMQRARQLDPNSVSTHTELAGALIRSGKIQEGLAESERVRRLDPLSFNAVTNIASAFRAAGQYDRAIAGFQNALAIEPRQGRAHFLLGSTYALMGRMNDAIRELEAAAVLSPGNSRFDAYLGYAYAAAGRRADAEKILVKLNERAKKAYVSSFGIAVIHDALGDKERAMAALEQAYEDHAVEFSQLGQYPPFASLRGTPRYEEIMKIVSRPR